MSNAALIPLAGAALLIAMIFSGAAGKGPLAIGWTVEEARPVIKACFREMDGLPPDPSLPRCR